MEEFKPNRSLLTSFYIASMFSFNLFSLISGLIFTWAQWLISVLYSTVVPGAGDSTVWVCLFAICLTLTLLIRRFIIKPLGFYVNGKQTGIMELVVLGILIFGFYVYSFNQLFPEYNMPNLPLFLDVVFGEAIPVGDVAFQNTWAIIPWIWYVGPLAWMYSIYLKHPDSHSCGDS